MYLVARGIAGDKKCCGAFLHGGNGDESRLGRVVPLGHGCLSGLFRLLDEGQILLEGVLTLVFAAARVGIIVGKGTLVGRPARVLYQHILQRVEAGIAAGQNAGHGLGHQHHAVGELLAAAHCKLASLGDVPGHQLHHLLGIGGRGRHVVAPHQCRRERHGVVVCLVALLFVPGLPTHAVARLLVFYQAPWLQVAERAHAALAYIIACQIHHGQTHEAADGSVGICIDLALTAADAKLSGHWSIEPRVGNPCVCTAQCATEIAACHGLGHCNENGHILGFAACHACIHGHMPRGGVAVGGWQHGDGLVPSIVGIVEIFQHFFEYGRGERGAVAPSHALEVGIYLVQSAMIHIVGDALSASGSGIFVVGDGRGERFFYLRPCHLVGVADQLFLAMGGKSTGIDCHSEHRHAVVAGRIACLIVEARSRDDDRRNAEFLGYDARAGLLRGADTAAAIAGNDRIYLEVDEPLAEHFGGLACDARCRVGACNGQLVVHNDFGSGIFCQDQPLEFGMGDVIHEVLAHDGDGFSVESRQSWRHLDGFHGCISYRAHHVECGFVGCGEAARVVTLEAIGLCMC